MEEAKGFILSLVGAAAASSLIEGFVPEGGLKKYVRYLISLILLLVLISPLFEIVSMLPTFSRAEGFTYDSVDALAKANSIVALHIERALCEKFTLSDSQVDAKYDGERIVVCIVSRPWLFEDDIVLYILNNFGVEAEVRFDE